MRVAISGSPTSLECCRLRSLIAAIDRRATLARRRPRGFDRNRTGSPLERNWTPWCVVGRKPLPQQRLAAVRIVLARQQHDEAGQVAVLAAEAVGQPRAHARPADTWWPVFMKICAGAWLNCVVCIERTMAMSSASFARLRQQLGDLRARLAVLLELERRAEQLRRALDEREALALDELRRECPGRRASPAPACDRTGRAGRRAGHEQVDDALRLRREVQRVRRRVLRPAIGEDDVDPCSDASARPPMPNEACSKKCAPGDLMQPSRAVAHRLHSLVTVSSRFSSTLATIVHAASSAASSSRPAPRALRRRFGRGSASVPGRRSRRGDRPPRARRLAREHQLDAQARRGPRRAAGPTAIRLRQRPRGLERRRVVEQRQRLQRRVRCGRGARCRTRGWSRRRS